MADTHIHAQEHKWLETVKAEIAQQLEGNMGASVTHRQETIRLQKAVWEEVQCAPAGLTDLEDATTLWQLQCGIASLARQYQIRRSQAGRLEQMAGNPYFGRIDFLETGEPVTQTLYLGLHSLTRQHSTELMVCDWRAPVAALFYDSEPGLCSYLCPAGRIGGELQLKRQYRITGGELEYMFDSQLNIQDMLLQDILGQNATPGMATIVASIQREQNAVIRNMEDRVLVVRGPAGSGKTSVALHRAAWLLYHQRETLRSGQFIVFSPNHVFAGFIAGVLPSLGEDPLLMTTFGDFFQMHLPGGMRREGETHQLSGLLEDLLSERRKAAVSQRGSEAFVRSLQQMADAVAAGAFFSGEDIEVCGQRLIGAEEMKAFLQEGAPRFSFFSRMQRLRSRIKQRLADFRVTSRQAGKETGKDAPGIREALRAAEQQMLRLTTPDLMVPYCGWLQTRADQNPEGPEAFTLEMMHQGLLPEEDAAPLVCLGLMLGMPAGTGEIRQVLIDEAQDYTPVQFQVFRLAFAHCHMTILGDEQQALRDTGMPGGLASLPEIFGEQHSRCITLRKSYRTTTEIHHFSRYLPLEMPETQQLERHGEKPVLYRPGRTTLADAVTQDVQQLLQRYDQVAVICRTDAVCAALGQHLEDRMSVTRLSREQEEYDDGLVILPVWLAKGLEFDAVLVPDMDDGEATGTALRMFYMTCTRARQVLHIYSTGAHSLVEKRVPAAMYQVAEK